MYVMSSVQLLGSAGCTLVYANSHAQVAICTQLAAEPARQITTDASCSVACAPLQVSGSSCWGCSSGSALYTLVYSQQPLMGLHTTWCDCLQQRCKPSLSISLSSRPSPPGKYRRGWRLFSAAPSCHPPACHPGSCLSAHHLVTPAGSPCRIKRHQYHMHVRTLSQGTPRMAAMQRSATLARASYHWTTSCLPFGLLLTSSFGLFLDSCVHETCWTCRGGAGLHAAVHGMQGDAARRSAMRP